MWHKRCALTPSAAKHSINLQFLCALWYSSLQWTAEMDAGSRKSLHTPGQMAGLCDILYIYTVTCIHTHTQTNETKLNPFKNYENIKNWFGVSQMYLKSWQVCADLTLTCVWMWLVNFRRVCTLMQLHHFITFTLKKIKQKYFGSHVTCHRVEKVEIFWRFSFLMSLFNFFSLWS